MAIWNLDTLDYQFIDIRSGTGYLGDHNTISPDGRYLVIARNNLRAWDLSLGSGLETTYNHPGPFARVRSVRFVDNVTIETTSSEGVQRWNVVTGAQVE